MNRQKNTFSKNYENEEIKFYREHKMAPSISEQENGSQFLKKRKKLYRQLGIPLLCIEDKNVIEFGASCGENSLPLLTGFGNAVRGVYHLDIVEPNESGREAIQKLFKQNDISSERYTLYSNTLENYFSDKKYDIIIAEQFLQHCINWKDCLMILKKFAKQNSIIIVTCADSIGLYVEVMKRFVAHCLVKDIKEFDDKIQKLVELFSSYLNSLYGMNKTHKDYIADQFFCDLMLNGAQMDMVSAIEVFQQEFDVLGASQNIFTDYSWYKDLEYDYVSDYKKQYNMKRHMFLFAGESEETIRSEAENELLGTAVEQALQFEARCEQEKSLIDFGVWKKIIDGVTKTANSSRLTRFNMEFLDILKRVNEKKNIDLANYFVLSGSFGKTSQYLSFVRK